VRKLIKIYKQINDLVSKFVDNDGLLIAEECDILGGFKCTGGIFARRRKLTSRKYPELYVVFDLEDSSGLPQTPLEIAEEERGLSSGCDTSFTTSKDCKDGDCTSCSGTTKITCKKNKLKCFGQSVEGLSIPFMSDLTSLVGLLSGGDIVSDRNVFSTQSNDRLNSHFISSAAGTARVFPACFNIRL